MVRENLCRNPSGSSPRGRGKPLLPPQARTCGRLIPAWAGKTPETSARTPAHPAHPRVGGENLFPCDRGTKRQGSSPRGRGKRCTVPCRSVICRLIPAWAGKTPMIKQGGARMAAHPRVGGENRVGGDAPPGPAGSSPRGRGKPRRRPAPRYISRLIPAWAGKTQTSQILGAGRSPHPRVGGENANDLIVPPRAAGSSPRGRGKRILDDDAVALARLIPAWAGKTHDRKTDGVRSQAHPRVGGENFVMKSGS